MRAKTRKGKDGLHSERRGFQGGEGGQARRASLGEVEGSMSGWVDARALQENLQSLSFTPSLAKPEMEKEFGRRRARSQDEKGKRVRVTRRGGKEALERRSGMRGGRKAAGDGATSRSVKAFQFGYIGNA